MANFGSSKGLVSQNLSQTMDNQGNPIISSDTTFGASPLGYAARVQSLFGLPNATFELTPPDTTLPIDQSNQLPYWDIQDYSAGVMSGSAIYDSTTNTWGIKLNPGTATTGDYLTMTTRSYLVNDDNLSLRQKALAVVSKNGTYSSTTQWSCSLTASYYSAADALLHSGTVATIYDNTTWTSMSGTTTTGGTAINAAAQYVDLTFTLTATAPVTSSTSVTIKSVLLQTSTGAAASSTFIVKESFTSSQTWTVPTGVTTLLSVVAYGAGGGGAGGQASSAIDTNQNLNGSQGGGGGALVAVENLDITGVGSVIITVGAGGSGGAGKTFNKARGSSTELLAGTATAGTNGSAGGATSFGGYLSITGGGGGTANVASSAGGGTAGVGSSSYFPGTVLAGGGGGTRNSGGASYVAIYNAALATGATGGSCTFSGGQTGTATAAGGTSFLGYGGRGGASSGVQDAAPGNGAQGTAGIGGAGGAGGSGGRYSTTGTATITVTGGNGGAGTAGGGGGGGGGVTAMAFSGVYSNTIIALTAGTGGTGGNGFVVITYVG